MTDQSRLPYRCTACGKRTQTYREMQAHHQTCLRFVAQHAGFRPTKATQRAHTRWMRHDPGFER